MRDQVPESMRGGGGVNEQTVTFGEAVYEKKPQRKFLPTLSDLVDRLTIVQQKAIFISDKRDEYVAEMNLILHDIDLILSELESRGRRLGAREVRAIAVIMLTNRFIWENESLARLGGPEHDRRLKLTHSVNGVRNTAKNVLAEIDGGRHDHKIDCFAAELVEDFGDWNVFGANGGSHLETDAEFRARLEKRPGFGLATHSRLFTASGDELDTLASSFFSERRRPC
jgi:hypothetical protein